MMKLLKPAACHSAAGRGNVKGLAVMGDAIVDRLSDRGSIPLSSILDASEETSGDRWKGGFPGVFLFSKYLFSATPFCAAPGKPVMKQKRFMYRI